MSKIDPKKGMILNALNKTLYNLNEKYAEVESNNRHILERLERDYKLASEIEYLETERDKMLSDIINGTTDSIGI